MMRPQGYCFSDAREQSSSLRRLVSILPRSTYLKLRRLYLKYANRRIYCELQRQRQQSLPAGYDYSRYAGQRAIFIHIPKCAGVSMSEALFGGLGGGHTTLEQYLDLFEPREILSFYKFAFVRNPWDRLLSAYMFLKRGGFDTQDRQWAEQHLVPFETFEEFVVHWVTPENIWKKIHFQPQSHFIFDQFGKVDLNYLGFFENLEHDFAHVAHKMGVSPTLPRANVSGHINFRKYYTDQTIKIVADVYARDIQLLGYSFDNASLPQQIEHRDRRYKVNRCC